MNDDHLLGESDWDDQDLLTTSDALDRVRAQLAEELAREHPDEVRVRALEDTDRRLTAHLRTDHTEP